MKKKDPIVTKQYFKVVESIFNRPVHVFLNYTHGEFAEWVREKGANDYKKDDDSDRNIAGFATVLEGIKKPDEWIICIKKFDWTIKDQGTLIHEIVHIIIKIWQANNIPYNEHTQEFLAHSIGNLYEDIAAKIFSVTKKKKK